MPAIHLVERMNNVTKIQGTADEWESGDWVVGDEAARNLVGGDLYLHSGQNEPSHFGGKILSYRVHKGGDIAGRVVFRIRATLAHKGIRTSQDGWGNEKKIAL